VVSKGGLRVLVVEDDAFTRMTLVTVVTSLGHEVTGQVGTVVDAMDEARTSRPDVVLLDLDLGAGPTGIDAAYGLRGLLPDVGIVVLSSYADARVMGRRARPLPPGALFVSKRDLSDVQVLEDAIRGSLQTDAPVVGPRGGVDFTDSQLELMRLVANGLSNDEIARRLWLTEPSVRRSITRLLRKLNIESSDTRNARVQLTRAYNELAGQVVRDEQS
jgi:DNA-binding NarL/FixJ family response regulator